MSTDSKPRSAVRCKVLVDKHKKARTVSGWAAEILDLLSRRGRAGITNLDCPGHRLANDINHLRYPKDGSAGINIKKITEPNTGSHEGAHGRWVLVSEVLFLERVGPSQSKRKAFKK